MMNENPYFPTGAQAPCTAFKGCRLIASGDIVQVLRAAKECVDAEGDRVAVRVFNDAPGDLFDLEYGGTMDEFVRGVERWAGDGLWDPAERPPPPGSARPAVGVVTREAPLLPRHWEWLDAQPGGAAGALRRLVEDAQRADTDRALGACRRVMSTLQDDWPNYGEAMNALSEKNQERFDAAGAAWPPDVRDYVRRLTKNAIEVPRV